MCKALRAAKLVSCRYGIVVLCWIVPQLWKLGEICTQLECAHSSVECQREHLRAYDRQGAVYDISSPLGKFALSPAYNPEIVCAERKESKIGLEYIVFFRSRSNIICSTAFRKSAMLSSEDEKLVGANYCSDFLLIARLDQKVEHFHWDCIRTLSHASGIEAGWLNFKLALVWCKEQNDRRSWRAVHVFLNPIFQFGLI
ncbi:unnamed protein product [Bubo scandiacus]